MMEQGVPHWTAERIRLPDTDFAQFYDVIVVGAGYTGLATALNLAQGGLSVCVLERGQLEDAASSRNAGFCTIGPPLSINGLLGHGKRTARQWFHWYQGAVDHCEAVIEQFDAATTKSVGFARVGNAKLAQTKRQSDALRVQQDLLAGIGVTRRFVTGDALEMPASGSVVSGLVDKQSARLNPGVFHIALAHKAIAAGVSLHLGTPATAILQANGRTQVSTPRGPVTADRLVVATNGFTDATVKPFNTMLFSIGSFLILTKPVPDDVETGALGRGRCHSTSYRFPHYFRMTPDRRILFGGRAGLGTVADLPVCAEWLNGRMQGLLPDLPPLAVESCWGGRLGFAQDKKPLLGQVNDRCFYAMGYSGHGVPTSIAMARDLANNILGSPSSARAPFWRDPSQTPQQIPVYLRSALPVAQVGLRMLDRADYARDWLSGLFRPQSFPKEKQL